MFQVRMMKIKKYQPATLFISGLVYFVIEPPGPPNIAHAEPSRVDGGSSELEQAAYRLPKPLPDGAFTYWFCEQLEFFYSHSSPEC